MENIKLLEHEITDLVFHLPQDGWPNSVSIETKFGVRINDHERDKLLLEISQKINCENENIAQKEAKLIFRMSIIGLVQIDEYTKIREIKSNSYNEGFKLLYKKLRRKIASLEKMTQIQFPPIPRWKDIKSKC